MAKAATKALPLSGARNVGRPKVPANAPLSLIRKLVATEQADGRWGSWFGMAYISGMFLKEQYDAGLAFADAAAARERALASPGCSPRAQDLSAVSGRSVEIETEAQIKRHRRALEEWDRIVSGLTKLQLHALDVIVVQMRPAEGFVQQVALRDGLDKLVAYQKMARRKR